MRRLPLSLLIAHMIATPAVASEWSTATAPSSGPAQVIGSTGNGCIAGASMLPPDGIGYEAIRLSRHRNYGHPDTVAFVSALGVLAHAAHLPMFYVGDMAQPRGGPMPDNHVAHENGLDVDIWFTFPAGPLPPASRETVALPSMLLPDGSGVDPARFGRDQVALLRLAARDRRVDRIFVNPAIKHALCRGDFGAGAGDRAWLRRIRPWYGHDDHFHVRLACPPGSPLCQGQAPVPAGEGCEDSVFAWWDAEFARLKALPPSPRRPRVEPVMPAACRALVTQH